MKCPFCNVEMIHGYLNCGMTLWSTKKHKISLLTDDDETFSLQLGKPALSPHHIESDCCPKCKRIIIACGLYVMQYHSYFAGTTVHQHYHEIRSVRASNDSGEICRN